MKARCSIWVTMKNNTTTPLKDNLQSVKKLDNPKNRKQIWQYLGEMNFERKYQPLNTEILDLLHAHLEKM